jgi:hypothetical protein
MFFHNEKKTKERLEEKRDEEIRKDTKNELDYVFWDQHIYMKDDNYDKTLFV